jgi:hypothetical protein
MNAALRVFVQTYGRAQGRSGDGKAPRRAAR